MISADVSKEVIELGFGLRTLDATRENITQSCTKLVTLGAGKAVVVVESIAASQFNQHVSELGAAGYSVRHLGDFVLLVSIK